jgi:hypothetical protein
VNYVNTFYPQYSIISSISLGVQTIITFTAPHEFTVGEIISFRVSKQYGTVELNNVQANVQSITSNTITVNIDSRNFTSFISSPGDPQTLAMVVPSSSGVITGAIPPQTNLFDVFDNIPPS